MSRPKRMSRPPHGSPPAKLPAIPRGVLRALLPLAERDEVIHDLAIEYAGRRERDGTVAARAWLWRQVARSAPALLRRTWWRGWSGFEPRANWLQPGGPVLESWIIDLRYSTRRLVSRPGYAALAVLTLALGAGGTAGIYSVARGLLFEPLPIAREGQVGVFWFPFSWTEEEFLYLRPDVPGFQTVAAWRPQDATLERPGEPLQLVPGIAGSAELFEVLGAGPMLGRTFEPGDDLPGAEPVAVISHGLWQDLGGDPTIVGRRLQLGGLDRTIVGVMPPGFWFPAPTTRVWMAAQLSSERRSGQYALVARVPEGASLAAAQPSLDAIGRALGERFTYPEQWDKTRAPAMTPVREYLIGDVRPAVVATFVAMALILLIACVNVAALMLGQVSGRGTELALRTALGAERGRLAQQLVLESLLVGLLAGLAGAALAAFAFGLLVQSLPLGALAEAARLDWRLLAAGVGIALVAAVAVALVPTFAMWRGNLQPALATTRAGGIAGRGGRLEGGLVVAQIALAVLLAAGAALLIRSVANLRALDPGVDVRGVAIVDATLPTQLDAEARRRAILEAVQSLETVPGVRAAAATQKLPLRGSGHNWGIAVEGRPDAGGTTAFRTVTHEYFRASGLQVRHGRAFEAGDRANTERVVVINEALAARYFPGEDPLGRVIRTFGDDGERIVGVVRNAAEASLTDAPVPARYVLYDQLPLGGPTVWHEVTFVVRAERESDLPALLQSVRGALQRDARHVAVRQITTLQSVFDRAVGPAGQLVTLLSLLAALALVLGGVGVYGVIAHFVARRRREYGIRLALGLQPGQVVLQVLRRGLVLGTAGSVIGTIAAVALTGLLSSLLYGVGSADPLALAGAVATLLAVSALAALVPAWRASVTEPAVVLREP